MSVEELYKIYMGQSFDYKVSGRHGDHWDTHYDQAHIDGDRFNGEDRQTFKRTVNAHTAM